MILRVFLLAAAAVFFCSCGPVIQDTVVPVTNRSGEVVVAKPKRFELNQKTKNSKSMALMEDIMEPFDEDWSDRMTGAKAELQQVSGVAVAMMQATVWRKSRSTPEMVYLPIILIRHLNIPQEQIDAAAPGIQRAVYNRMARYCEMIRQDELREDVEIKRPD
ncbi:MAG: hypothetical protein AAGC74_05725 [Verrucomicrobiota bacterium]